MTKTDGKSTIAVAIKTTSYSESYTNLMDVPTARELEACPVCKSDQYLDPNLRFLVSPCYHRVCETCVDRLFAHGAAPCPVCSGQLRRGHFVLPTFEDMQVERECRIRKRIASTFNKREEDFATLRDYNDYLEEVEEIIFNLMNEVDVQRTEARLEAYRQQNAEQIARNRQKEQWEGERAKRAREEEEMQRMEYEATVLAELEAEAARKRQEELIFIESLARSGPSSSGRKRARMVEEATLSNMLPSFKGLRPVNGQEDDKLPPLDPFDTVPELTLPELPMVDNFAIFESILSGSKPITEVVLLAGGLKLEDVLRSCLFSLLSH